MKGPILLLGARGLLGSEIASAFSSYSPKVDLYKKDSTSLDLADRTAVEAVIKEIKPYWIVNAFAYTDVDKAETERQKAELFNSIIPRELAELASKSKARLVDFSTDYVFSGEGDRPWSENDPKAPIKPNWYGETKLMGETAVLEYSQNLVIRVQWLYGTKKNRFTSLKDKQMFSPFKDQFGAPTWTRDVVRSLLTLMDQEATGLFHFAYDDFASWMDVYQFVKDEMKLPVKLNPALTKNSVLPARRPLNGRLSNDKLKKQLGVQSLGSWKNSLREFLHQVSRD